MAINEKALGPDHPDVARSLNNLAALYETQGRYADAEPLYKRSLAIREKALGPDHPDVASIAEQSGGRSTAAKVAMPMPNRCTSDRWRYVKKRLVPIIPMSRISLNNLAELYSIQGRYADAEPLYKRSLAIQEKVLGPDHPDVAQIAEQSGVSVQKQGRYADAEPLYQAVIGNTAKKRSVPIIPMSRDR